jgi:Zn-dependent alcohol dehydrogenase
VGIDIAFCGVCHTDLHFAKNDWGRSNYPLGPGHEIVGTVNAVGAEVKKFKLGQKVAVGCFVNSCHTCSSCAVDLEQYCLNGVTGTYNAASVDPGGFTYGGYSKHIVVDEHDSGTMPRVLVYLEHVVEDGVPVRVGSMPCTNVFDRQDAAWRAAVLPAGVPRVAVEAGVRDGWFKYVGAADAGQGVVIGLDRFGESAPYKELFEYFGITTEAVVNAVISLFQSESKRKPA